MLCSLSSTCCYCLATRSHHSVQLLLPPLLFTAHHTPLSLQLVDKIDAILLGFVQFLFAILFTPHHFYQHTLRSTQLHFANVVVKLLFPSTFFSLCHSNHTNQIAASITQNVIHLLHSYNIRHFHTKTSFSSSLQLNFSSPSTPPFY